MKPRSVALILLSVFLACLAIDDASALNERDLIGTWIIEAPSPQGMIPQTVEFKAAADQKGVSGVWSSHPRWEDDKVTEVSVEGMKVSFRLDANGNFRGWWWQGQFDGPDHFTMSLMGDSKVLGTDGIPIWSRSFRRASPRAVATLEANAPKDLVLHKLPLPPLRRVPSNWLARTPPMGWNSWNFFQEGIDDKTVREIADALVSSGLRDAGYVYVNIDDGWQGRRDEQGTLQPNSKFPDMRVLGDYVHARGLKFGLYTVAGPITCVGWVGSHGYEVQDAKTFAAWGADYVKYDWCTADSLYQFKSEARAIYQKMGEALQATGRPMIYSLCTPSVEWGLQAGRWGREVGGNLWRTSGDSFLGDRWRSLSIRFSVDGDPAFNGPGGWNDPDIMLIGLDGLTTEENRTNMTLWSMLAAPLLLGNDVRHMTKEVKEILTNKEVIAIDQDTLGKQGRRAAKSGDTEVWTKRLADGSTAVALFNRGATNAEISVRWGELGLQGAQHVRDLWQHKNLRDHPGGYSASVPRHGSVLLRVRGG